MDRNKSFAKIQCSNAQCEFHTLILVFYSSNFSMEHLKLGSLNINAGRDRNKLAMIAEFVKQIDIVFLQETHTSNDNETQWCMWWE